MPGLVRCHMGEQVGPGHVASRQDVGVNRFQKFVGLDRAAAGLGGQDAQFLQAEAAHARHAAHGAQQRVKRDADLLALVLQHQRFWVARGWLARSLGFQPSAKGGGPGCFVEHAQRRRVELVVYFVRGQVQIAGSLRRCLDDLAAQRLVAGEHAHAIGLQ